MSDFVIAVSSDGQKFKIHRNGTWSIDGSALSGEAAFRGIAWGASKREVMALEKTEFVFDDPDLLAYKAKIADLSTLIAFQFIDDKFVMGRYHIDEPHAHESGYLADFERLKDLLIKKYGKQKSSDAFWANDLYRDDYSEWGMAVSCGHVSFFEVWEDADTHIELGLFGDNYEVKLVIRYESVALIHLLKNKREMDVLSDL